MVAGIGTNVGGTYRAFWAATGSYWFDPSMVRAPALVPVTNPSQLIASHCHVSIMGETTAAAPRTSPVRPVMLPGNVGTSDLMPRPARVHGWALT